MNSKIKIQLFPSLQFSKIQLYDIRATETSVKIKGNKAISTGGPIFLSVMFLM